MRKGAGVDRRPIRGFGLAGAGGGLQNQVFLRQDRCNGLLLDGMQLLERAIKGAIGIGEEKELRSHYVIMSIISFFTVTRCL